MLFSSSEGFWRDGLFAAILLRALMVTVCGREVEWETFKISRELFCAQARWLA